MNQLSWQMRQEAISRGQLTARFAEFGWVTTPTSIDVGEDFIVTIFIDGNSTGRLFQVQLKSVTNLHERINGHFLKYKFEKKNLIQWETYIDPVVLIIWDTHTKEGRWALVDYVIQRLDKTRPKWRDNKTKVSVDIPATNSTQDSGLRELFSEIGKTHIIPRLKSEGMRVKTNFPDTEAGRIEEEEFKRITMEGGQALFSGSSFKFPIWFSHWIDTSDVKFNLKAELPAIEIQSEISIFSNKDVVKAYQTIFQLSERRLGYAKLSNAFFDEPLEVELELLDLTGDLGEFKSHFSVNNYGTSIIQAREILQFIQALNHGGFVKIQLSIEGEAPVILEARMSAGGFDKFDVSELLECVDDIIWVQSQVPDCPHLYLPKEGLTQENLTSLKSLVPILKYGERKGRYQELPIVIKKIGLISILEKMEDEGPIRLEVDGFPDETFKLLGVDISVGPYIRFITGQFEISAEKLSEEISSMKEDGELELVMRDPEIIDKFPERYAFEAERIRYLLKNEFQLEAISQTGPLTSGDFFHPDTNIEFVISDVGESILSKINRFLSRNSNFPIVLYELTNYGS